MFILREGNIIKRFSKYYFEDSEETDKEIVEGFDHLFYFKEETQTEEYIKKKKVFENNQKTMFLIEEKKMRLEELRKDFEEERQGFFVENIEERKAEYRTLLNEVRELQGKPPKELKIN